jgi:glycosyltransferase involved in cell wall biosynthesis
VQSPRDLADKIMLLINNPELTKLMGTYAKHLSETRFSWRSVARQIVKVYDQLLERRSA